MSDKRAIVWVFLPVHRGNSQHSCGGETWGRMAVDFRSEERNTSRCCPESKHSPGIPLVSDSHKAPKKARERNKILLTWEGLLD